MLLPMILKEVVDSIICDPAKKRTNWLFEINDEKCRTEFEVYILIAIYAAAKLSKDAIAFIREVPYSYVSAMAEISIAHDVYDHI